MEMTNIHPGAIEEVYKCASINLSPNTMGQIALSCLVSPPKPGEGEDLRAAFGSGECFSPWQRWNHCHLSSRFCG